MNLENKEPKPKRRLLLKFGVCLLPFLIIASTLLFTGGPSGDQPVASISSQKFEDGYEIQILEAVVGQSLEMKGRYQSSKWNLMSRGGSRGGGRNGLSYRVQKKNGKLTSALVTTTHNELKLLVRLITPEGEEVYPEVVAFDGIKELSKINWDADKTFQSFDNVPVTVTPQPIPEYYVEIEDGAGGWIGSNGPIAFGFEDGRAFVTATAFPRTGKNLKLRVTRPNVEPVIVEIPNPGFSTTRPATWVVDPKPWKKKLTLATVELTSIKRPSRSESNTKAVTEISPRFKITSNSPDQNDDAFRVRSETISDEQGNYLRKGALNLPGTDKLKIAGSVYRTSNFQWDESQIDFLAEGVWAGKNPHEDLEILSEGKRIGVSKIRLAPGATGKSSVPKWMVYLEGKGDGRVVPKSFDLIIFHGNDTRSKNGVGSGGGSSSTSGNAVEYNRSTSYFKNIPPGEKIRIGLLPSSSAEHFEFIVPVETK